MNFSANNLQTKRKGKNQLIQAAKMLCFDHQSKISRENQIRKQRGSKVS